MALETARKRRKRLSMTSLIDVIFLLLLFFMLTSTFSKYGEIELTGGAAGAPAQSDHLLRFLKLDDGRVLLNGDTVTLETLNEHLSSDKEQIIVLSLSDETTSQQLMDALTILRPLPNTQTMVLR